MRLRSITLKGFGSHLDGSTFDFADAPLTLIYGPNGSGKSTLFIGVKFALFGKADTGPRGLVELIHDEAEAAETVLEFSDHRALVRVTRTLKRRSLKSDPDAFTQTAQVETAPLDQPDAFEPVEKKGSVTGVNRWLAERLGVSYEAFLACLLLEQDKWLTLLLATPAERQKILIGLGIEPIAPYEEVHKVALERLRKANDQRDTLRAQLGGRPLVTAAQVADAAAAQQEATSAMTVAQQRASAATTTHQSLRRLADLHAQLEVTQQQLATERGLLGDVEAVEQAAGASEAAARVLPHAEAYLGATRKLADLQPRSDELAAALTAKRAAFSEMQAAVRAAREMAERAEQHERETAAALTAVQADLKTTTSALRDADAAAPAWERADHLSREQRVVHEQLTTSATVEAAERRAPVLQRIRAGLAALAAAEGDAVTARDAAGRADTARAGARATADAQHAALTAAQQAASAALEARQAAEHALALATQHAAHCAAEQATLADAHAAGTCPVCTTSLSHGDGAAAFNRRHATVSEALVNATAEVAARQAALAELAQTATATADAEALARAEDARAQATLTQTEEHAHQAATAQQKAEARVAQVRSALNQLLESVDGPTVPDAASPDTGPVTAWVAQAEEATAALLTHLPALVRARARWSEIDAELTAVRAAAAKGDPTHRAHLVDHVATLTHQQTVAAQRAETARADALTARRAADDAQRMLSDLRADGERLAAEEKSVTELRGAHATQRDYAATHVPAELLAQLDTYPEDALARLRDLAEPVRLAALVAQRDRARAAERTVAQLQTRADTLSEQLGTALAPTSAELDAAEAEATLAASVLRETAEQVATTARLHERLQVTYTETMALQDEVVTAERNARLLDTLAKRLGKQGLIARLVGQLQEELIGEANDVLQRLSSGSLSLELDPLSSSEEMDFVVRDMDGGGNVRSMKRLSGGQRFRLAVAFSLGISAHMAKHSTAAKLDTLMIDEGFGSLDEEGKVDMTSELLALREVIPCVVAVTHDKEIAEHFQNRYFVSRTDGCATAVRNRLEEGGARAA